MHELRLQIGPARFRLLSDFAAPIRQMRSLYAAYPEPDYTDFTIRLEATGLIRRFIRPQIAIGGDFAVADAAPLPAEQGLLAAEMAMNLNMALGWRRHLILHCSAAEKHGKTLLMTGLSGSGKSTMSALLGEHGWRFMGDEFALIDLTSGAAQPFPRLVSLKNEAVAFMQERVDASRFGPLLAGTPKGDIRHLIPRAEHIAAMQENAPPALLLYPRFGHEDEVRQVPPEENFIRLTQASTNYVALGEAGFDALTKLVQSVPALAMDYKDGLSGMQLLERLWANNGGSA